MSNNNQLDVSIINHPTRFLQKKFQGKKKEHENKEKIDLSKIKIKNISKIKNLNIYNMPLKEMEIKLPNESILIRKLKGEIEKYPK